MMHGHEKSDLVIVAMRPANKAREAHRGGVCGGGRSGVGGAKGGGQGEYAPAKHALDSEPGSRVTGAGAYTARQSAAIEGDQGRSVGDRHSQAAAAAGCSGGTGEQDGAHRLGRDAAPGAIPA